MCWHLAERFDLSMCTPLVFIFFLLLGDLLCQKASCSHFDLGLKTLDVSKTWLQPSSHFQTSSSTSSSQSLPPSIPSAPKPFPWLLPYPITHIASMIFPLYPFRVFPIPVECGQYSWDNRGLTGWLASAGNREFACFL